MLPHEAPHECSPALPIRNAECRPPRCVWIALLVLLTAAAAGSPEIATLEDPLERAALPEFKIIPAAEPGELTPAVEISSEPFNHWTRSQGDNGSRRYSALKQITRENVGALEVAWTYRSQDGAANIQCTPIVVDGMLYAPTPGRAMVALDAATGVEQWRFQVERPARLAPEDAPARRGLVYWPGDRDNAPRILFGSGYWIYAIDPKSGKLLPEFGERGRTAIPTGATVAGAIHQHVYVTGGIRGDIYGYDVRTGKMLWRFHSIPRGDEFGAETWEKPQYGAHGWAGISVDDQRGIAFIALGNPSPDMVGIGRLGDNLFSNCILALDVLSGKRLWHFQNVRHDIWDLDTCAAPNLVTITRDGRRVDVVTGLSKAGVLMLLDRTSGKPVFPFRLRRAPVSTLPGERTAPYQPDPELPEQISHMAFNPADITTRTPEAHAFVLKTVERSNYGFYAPHIEGKPTLYIGSRGGAEWSGAAVDVPTGRLYVTSNRLVSRITVIANDERERDPRSPPSAGENHYKQHCAACHGPTRAGIGMAPPLFSLKTRMSDDDVLELLKTGRAGMPPNHLLDATEQKDLLDYLFRRNQPPPREGGGRPEEDVSPKYAFDGFKFLEDHEGYPGINPPWGLLNCYDLNTGKILWRAPLGEFEKLTREGVPKTGSQNLGGATVTAGGLVFVAGTEDEKLRAFDADRGAELWSAKLPFAGTAAPAVYEVGGRQFVVITATGGGRVGGASGPGDAYVAFALVQASTGSATAGPGQVPISD
jgi:quinoprotein glucose dehydrogenase